jgi:hypothetical protein
VAIEVFEGNTADPRTLGARGATQIIENSLQHNGSR